MQTRVDAEFVVFIQVEGRKPGYQRHRVKDVKQESSQNTNDNQNQESEFRNYRQGLGRIRIDKQRGVVYNITINWLTLNRHRIKINILMG